MQPPWHSVRDTPDLDQKRWLKSRSIAPHTECPRDKSACGNTSGSRSFRKNGTYRKPALVRGWGETPRRGSIQCSSSDYPDCILCGNYRSSDTWALPHTTRIHRPIVGNSYIPLPNEPPGDIRRCHL